MYTEVDLRTWFYLHFSLLIYKFIHSLFYFFKFYFVLFCFVPLNCPIITQIMVMLILGTCNTAFGFCKGKKTYFCRLLEVMLVAVWVVCIFSRITKFLKQ